MKRTTPMVETDIPKLIKQLRANLGLTQEQFAQKLGVTFSSVNHWENGKRTPQPFLVRAIVELRKSLPKDIPVKKKGRTRRGR